MSLIFFSAKMILISGLLFTYYWMFLRNKKFHQYNRFFLLAIPSIAICLPLLNIPIPGFDLNKQSTAIKILNVVTVKNWEDVVVITPENNYFLRLMTWQNISLIVFIVIAMILLFVFIRNLLHVKKISSKYPFTQIQEIRFFNTEEPGTPFSFLKNIFWNRQIDANTEKGKQIFRHELFHVRQKHTTDILFMEVTSIVFWFNPFFHFIKKEIKTVHEFLADQYAASETNNHDYAELLALSAATNYHLQIANSFFNNQLKRRIAMLTQFPKTKYGYISRLMALPLLFILICAFAVKINKPKNTPRIVTAKQIVAVIDAGHGGIYNGTRNNNGIEEKKLSLSIAKEIQQLSKEYNVNVILTRDKDAAVGNASTLKEDLQNRVNIAAENKADVFVSIHTNADFKPVSEKSGFEVFVSNKENNQNLSKSKILGSALIGELKNSYKTDEQLKQHDRGVVILDKNVVPSAIVECGYLTNKNDVDFIIDPKNQEKIARNILEGIVKYNAFGNQSKSNNDSKTETHGYVYDSKKNILQFPQKNGDTITAQAEKYVLKMEGDDSLIIKSTTDTTPLVKEPQNIIFTKVEVESQYPGGQNAWNEYLSKNLKYPQDAVKRKVQGTVIVQFIVDTDGSVSDIKILKKPDASLSEACYNIIKNSGKWTPAMQNGKKVRSYKKQPIVFKLES